ncbi:MAG: hypothetical protein LBV55_01430, partial [Acholeplasmatales bacterium]|nr:hypothetical protein [Acholeplasmatales bacterium]
NNLDQDLLLADFQTINAALKRVLWEFYLDYHLEANQKHRGLNPYRSANIIINEEEVGLIGEIILNKNEKVWVVELDLDFINDDKVKAIELVSLSKYPSITRDIAFYVDQKITNRELEELITQTTKKYLIDLKIFDIYAAKDDSNRKSIAYHLTFNDPTKTLESLEVDKLMQSLVNRLEWTFKASIRKG